MLWNICTLIFALRWPCRDLAGCGDKVRSFHLATDIEFVRDVVCVCSPSPGCGWALAEDPVTGVKNETAGAGNCQYIADWMSALAARGVNPGVYVSEYMWSSIVGSSCSSASSHALWYPHYDGSPSFSDYTPFGGWSKPAIKQYAGSSSDCGAGIDSNW
jgi:hypothetical protein